MKMKVMVSLLTEYLLGGDWETRFIVLLNLKKARYPGSLHLAVNHLVLQLFVHCLLLPQSANMMQQDHMKSLVRQCLPHFRLALFIVMMITEVRIVLKLATASMRTNEIWLKSVLWVLLRST